MYKSRWKKRTVRVKCLAQEHNTIFPARAGIRTAQSGVERNNQVVYCTFLALKLNCFYRERKEKYNKTTILFPTVATNDLVVTGAILSTKIFNVGKVGKAFYEYR